MKSVKMFSKYDSSGRSPLSFESASFSSVSEPDSADVLPPVKLSNEISDGLIPYTAQMIEVRNVIHLANIISENSMPKFSKLALLS